jgi:hypothetical protein
MRLGARARDINQISLHDREKSDEKIFRDFCRFCAEKMAFFLKEWYDRIFAKTSGSWGKKTPIFSPKCFAENNFKIKK